MLKTPKLKTILIDGWRKGINSKDEGLKVLSIFELKQNRTQFLKWEIFEVNFPEDKQILQKHAIFDLH